MHVQENTQMVLGVNRVYLIRGGSAKYLDNLESVWNPDGQKVTRYYAKGLNDLKSAWMTCKMCKSYIFCQEHRCVCCSICVFFQLGWQEESLCEYRRPKYFPGFRLPSPDPPSNCRQSAPICLAHNIFIIFKS